jgi:hypothetical protein
LIIDTSTEERCELVLPRVSFAVVAAVGRLRVPKYGLVQVQATDVCMCVINCLQAQKTHLGEVNAV